MADSTLFRCAAARLAARLRPRRRAAAAPVKARPTEPGISVVIPSRNGRELLRAQLPGIVADLSTSAAEIVVVDNGSSDGTAEWLCAEWPQTVVEVSPDPLSFARAVNRGIVRARYSHVCLLNNDMLIDRGFFAALRRAFDQVPNLFCATAQIRFPEGVRRQETGKAVMAQSGPEDFPIRCDEPLPGEDLTYVLYGSGGCSLYDAAKLHALGNVDEAYEPAYVEDLDLGYRAWQRGWSSVYVAGAVVEHRHRATTSRYYSQQQLDTILEINHLKFLARAVAAPRLFLRLWEQAIARLGMRAGRDPAAREALKTAASIVLQGGVTAAPLLREESFLALTDGSVAVFPGRAPAEEKCVLIASPSLMARKRSANPGAAQVLVAFTDELATPPAELLDLFAEIVLVRRSAAAAAFSLAFAEVLHQTVRKWRPSEARLESTALAQYTADCAPARVTLIK